MTLTTAINVLIGAGLPPIIAIVNQRHWSPKVKAAVALVVSALAAFITEGIRDNSHVHFPSWLATAIIMTGSALVSYQTLWRPSTIAPAIEAGTTITTP